MNRYHMDLPVVGIRPTIDGRRNGVRESLEDQTMGMALAAKKLIEETLRYPNGEPVKVVIADTTIGGVMEAAKCQTKFEKLGVGGPLHHQGGLGLQRHRAPRRSVPGLCSGFPCPEGSARVQHLRP